MGAATERHLYVTWRRPDRLIVPVGLLTQRATADGVCYEFVYLKLAEQQADFEPLPGFPDLHRRYASERLFPVFANRQMPRERPDYDAFVQQLNLDVAADPFEVLARSEGRRATDRIEVFAAPARSEDGQLLCTFFARGVRHIEEAAAAIEQLSVGDSLELEQDLGNPVNPRALLINTQTGEPVGYAPDYLVGTIHELQEREPVTVVVEHINPPDSAPHMRLLCRMTAHWPEGFEPLSDPDFQPLVE